MNPPEGLLTWTDTLTDAPGAKFPVDIVRYGLPLYVGVVFAIVTPAVRFVSATTTDPMIVEPLVLVTIIVADQIPVERLRVKPV
jgi:hypothetical protein